MTGSDVVKAVTDGIHQVVDGADAADSEPSNQHPLMAADPVLVTVPVTVAPPVV